MGLKFRSPIYWEYKFNGSVNKLCYTCGVRYDTTFKKIEKKKDKCPYCKYREAI